MTWLFKGIFMVLVTDEQDFYIIMKNIFESSYGERDQVFLNVILIVRVQVGLERLKEYK